MKSVLHSSCWFTAVCCVRFLFHEKLKNEHRYFQEFNIHLKILSALLIMPELARGTVLLNGLRNERREDKRFVLCVWYVIVQRAILNIVRWSLFISAKKFSVRSPKIVLDHEAKSEWGEGIRMLRAEFVFSPNHSVGVWKKKWKTVCVYEACIREVCTNQTERENLHEKKKWPPNRRRGKKVRKRKRFEKNKGILSSGSTTWDERREG